MANYLDSDGLNQVLQSVSQKIGDEISSIDGTEVVDNLSSTATDQALSANQGRVLHTLIEDIAEESDEPLSTEEINNALTAAGFPAVE